MTATDLLVLHTLRCIGSAGLARVACAAGMPERDVESELIDLAVAGLVTRRPGEFSAWGLTGAGRIAVAERIADELAAAGTRQQVVAAYDRFDVLNPELLDLCAAWQLRSVDGVRRTNDHTDPAYDARVLDLLTDLDARTGLVCAELTAALSRFGRYRERFTLALDQVRSGRLDQLTDSLDSYHMVWFQLHEDLLTTLGRPRY